MQNILWAKIKALQEEAKILQNVSDKKNEYKKKSGKSLYGFLAGHNINVSWKEFQEAKGAIFSHSESHIK